jgi:hypothetical protein
VVDACRQSAIPLEGSAGGERLVRCIRHAEIAAAAGHRATEVAS